MTERIAPLCCTEKPTDTTGTFPVASKPKTTRGFLPLPCCPQTQRRRVSPLRCIKNLHRRTEGFPSPLHQSQRRQGGFLPPAVFPTDERRGKPLRRVKAHINMARRISPPLGCPDTTDQGLPLSVATKTYIYKRKGFPPRRV